MKRVVSLLAALILFSGSTAPLATQVHSQDITLHGFAYGPFREGQSPDLGIFPTAEQIIQDMSLLKLNGNALRTYGCVNLQAIADKSSAAGIKLVQGIWLDKVASDQDEMDCAIALTQIYNNIVLLIAGNERVLFNHMSVDEVCGAIASLKQRTDIPVTTAEPWQVWRDNPTLAACADVLLVHIHPYWDCQPITGYQATAYVEDVYTTLTLQYPNKQVIIGETGWPSQGPTPLNCDTIVPSQESQKQFAQEFVRWANATAVDYFFFEAFDEPWKCGINKDSVECHWGIYDTQRLAKPAALAFHDTIWLPLIAK